ncbi:hypothetical protein KJ819_01830 [Patescibacteria group bacterium]|nr:hypothetical protein [Patescibacteria group bacterium]MBU1500977.1 hypothetical protein [Patescibacteria group bacterium]MBU2080607.1 hypothetical protein [Patescibacteria group bacterium]MBU2124318.1 hypothetical protein [Patescibacteria group bacterium]MBU2194444.1 hypothetical protein [Patescibacteria group bacterium]
MTDAYVIYPEVFDVAKGAQLVIRVFPSGLQKIRKDPMSFAYGLLRAQEQLEQQLSLSYHDQILLIEGYVCSAIRGPDMWSEMNDFLCLLDMCTGLELAPIPERRFRRRKVA